MSSPEENASQGSGLSLDLQLSQDTVQQVLNAVGFNMSSGSESNRFVELFQSDTDLEEGDQDPPVTGTSSISISRAIVHSNSSMMPMWGTGATSLSQGSTFSSSQPPAPTHHPASANSAVSGISNSHAHSPSPHQASVSPHEPSSSTHFLFDNESPLVSSATSRLLTPPPSTSLYSLHSEANSYTGHNIRPNIPSNFPMTGEYNFELVFTADYSNKVQRAYIKQGQVIPFNFKVLKPPPPDSVIRVMAIHKAPEMISENLTCCPKHVDEQKRAGKLFPYHFVRPQDRDTNSRFCEDVQSKRLSVTTPFSLLQKKPPNTYTALYLFPCFTSEFQKSGQNVQLIFTLECMQDVIGRATVDIRVCASPGRDKDVDEKRASGETNSPNVVPDPPPTSRRGRKRGGRSTQEEVIQCTVPPKQVCHGLSGRKVDHTIHTFPEIIPFIEVCVKMMEQVYNVPVDINAPSTSTAAINERTQQTQPSFNSVESWLEHLDLGRYHSLLQKHGVNQLFQVPGVTEEELKRWGMKSAQHRKKFMEGKMKITSTTAAPPAGAVDREDETMQEGTPPLFGSQSPVQQGAQSTSSSSSTANTQPITEEPPRLSHPPSVCPPSSSSMAAPSFRLSQPSNSQQSFIGGSLSQSSISSTQPFLSSTFEVLQIQLRKTFT